MAFSMMPTDDAEESMMAEINVTPLVDVMLVLLIIFMIAAPMLHQGIDVQLPQASAENLPMRVEDPLVLSINQDGLVYIQDQPVHPTQLMERLSPILQARGDDSVFLKGDHRISYGKIVEVLDILHGGGVVHVGMVTERKRRSGR